MAQSYDKKIDKTIDWGGDEQTGGLGVKGSRVQEFIKDQLEHRIGVLYFDTTANRYLAFADETNKNLYLEDTSKTDLIIGTFDAPFNYSASIKLSSPQVSNILKGKTGNYINFTFDTFNKEGSSVGEAVLCTYTFKRGTTRQEVSAKYDYLESVSFPIDDYLQAGSNIITISIQGQTTMAATSLSVVYNVIDLQLTDTFDISAINDISDGGVHQIEVPYEVSGQGTKEMEWYVDGVALDYNKDEDEILESSAARVKYIDISNLSDGVHFLQIRVSTTTDGEKFYADTLYREFFVRALTTTTESVLAMATSIPASIGVLTELNTKIYNINQYEPCGFAFAVYNPLYPVSTNVEIYINDSLESTLAVANETVESYSYTPFIPGAISVKFVAGSASRVLDGTITGSSMGVQEITSGLAMAFRSAGRSNSSTDKDTFVYEGYTGEFSGFLWNETSGWVNDALLINDGASFNIDWAPLGNNPTGVGRTLEFSFCTTGVSNDKAKICSLMSDGIGLEITASEITLTSREGQKVSTKFKSEEDVRISLVINRATGVTNKGLAFIYINGILSGATKFSTTDSFTSDIQFSMAGSAEAEVKLYQIRAYNMALSADQVLNNYILYQNTSELMQTVYYRNDVTDSTGNALSLDKLEKFLPVMLITGNIPVLENTKNKKEQIVVDVDYYNLQDPTKSFTMKSAAMTPQGTSSMSYPKKNFKLYTQKIDDTKVYDYQGNEIKDKLYAFKDGAQPVMTWCLKADYAESSSTHNTGIARLWNDAMYNASIDGEYKLRTGAQKAALANNYEYDVRTTVDGFPILMFYRLTETSDIVFIGKYNFNNDKSTESVFGFKDIPGFDNTRMQCWEVLNNGNHLALFQDVENFDTEWEDAFESRYPDVGSDADTIDLKAFATWLVGVKDDATTFATEKWNHLDIYKVAAYYIYLMRFGAVDQTVKNAMLTSEDGEHFYFINYDNDTINGVRNDGLLIYDPTITRQSLDESYSTTVYAYAGHDSTLWNRLEADSEFMEIVATVDNALYQSGLRYADVIDMFNNQQSSKWCEKIYNQDAQYKYIGPYVNDGVDNLYMLQGSRASHRQWWLSRRFNLVDSWYVSGAYKSNVLECKMASAPAGIQFSITAGYDMNYGYGVNNIVVEKGVALKTGESHIFTTKQVLNIGDPMRIYTANNLEEADLSGFILYLSTVNVSSVNDAVLGTKLKALTLGDGTNVNTSLSEIQGLSSAKRLEQLNIEGYEAITALDLSWANYLVSLAAAKSGLKSVTLPVGNPYLKSLALPDSLTTLELNGLKSLTASGIVIPSYKNLVSATITNTPKCSDYSFVLTIITQATNLQTLVVDNINWQLTPEQLVALVKDKTFKFDFRGKVQLSSITAEYVDEIMALYGDRCFEKDSAFYITAPDSVFLHGDSTVLEGDNAQFKAIIFSMNGDTSGTLKYSISSGSRTGTSIDAATGLLTTTENGYADSTLTIQALFVSSAGKSSTTTKSIVVKKRTYPTATELGNLLVGTKELETVGQTITISCDLSSYTGRIASYEWSLTEEEAGYFEIVSQLNNTCKIKLLQEVSDAIGATLTLKITKVIGSTISGTCTISAKNENIAISAKSNPYVMKAFYQAGLAANENYMTKAECALVVDSDFSDYNHGNGGFFYKLLWINDYKKITTFNEFKYFTSLTKVPKAFFGADYESNTYYANLTEITIPENIKVIGEYAFYIAPAKAVQFYSNLKLPAGLEEIRDRAFNNREEVDFDWTVFLGDNLKVLFLDAFYNFKKVKKVVIPDSVTSMSNYTWYVKAEEIYIGAGVTGCISPNIKSTDVDIVHIGKNETITYEKADSIPGFNNYVVRFLNFNISYKNDQGNTKYKTILEGNALAVDSTIMWYKPEGLDYINTNLVNEILPYSLSSEAAYIGSLFKEGVQYDEDISFTTNSYGGYGHIFKNVKFKNITLKFATTSFKEAECITFDNRCYSAVTWSGNGSKQYFTRGKANKIVFGESFEPYDGQYGQNGFYCPYECTNIETKTTTISVNDGIVMTNDGRVIMVYDNGTGVYNFENATTSFYFELPSCSSSKITINLPSTISLNSLVLPNTTIELDIKDLQQIETPLNYNSINENMWKYNILTSLEVLHCSVLNYYLCEYSELRKLYLYASTAPSCSYGRFYYNNTKYMGKNSKSAGNNTLYVPADATGYDVTPWTDYVLNADKCGFTLSKTL